MTWGDIAGEDGAENSRGGAAPVSNTIPQAASHWEADGASSGRAVATLEETERTARRVLGGAHPATEGIEFHLREARAALRARENAATGDPD